MLADPDPDPDPDPVTPGVRHIGANHRLSDGHFCGALNIFDQGHNKKHSGDYPGTMTTKATAKLVPRATTHVSFKGKGKGQRKTN